MSDTPPAADAAPRHAPLTLTQPREWSFSSLSAHGFHRVVWYEWGAHDADRVVVCVHGVGRNGRDFDVLAEALAPTHRVLAIDMPGRGRSDWLADPHDYSTPTYLATLAALIAASGASRVDWVGTSMGGLLGMVMAAQPRTPLRRLVVNDVGPLIEPAALARIGTYLGADPAFDSYGALEAYVRTVSAPFGPLDDAQWAHLVGTNVRRDREGKWRLGYDPGIGVPFRAQPVVPELWPVWDAIRLPVLVLRGAESDLLSRATAEAMTRRGPRARLVEFPGVGHAPALMDPVQVGVVAAYLRE